MKQAVAHIEPEIRGLRLLVAADTDEVIARSCDRKRAYGPRCARLVAERRRQAGEHVSPYRCFYCGAWHVGRAPTYEGLRRIAVAIRDLHGNRPTSDLRRGTADPWPRAPESMALKPELQGNGRPALRTAGPPVDGRGGP